MRIKISTKKEILEKTLKIIEIKGLEQCTMRQIAKEADIAIGTLYNYFSSQEDLYAELFQYSWETTIERLSSIDKENQTPKQAYKEYFNVLKEEVKNRRGLGKLLLNGIPTIDMLDDEKFVMNRLPHTLKEILVCSPKLKGRPDKTITDISYMVLVGMVRNIYEEEEDTDLIDALSEWIF